MNENLQEEIQRLISKYALAMATILGCAAEEAIEESQAKNKGRKNNKYSEHVIAGIVAEVDAGTPLYNAMAKRGIPAGSQGMLARKIKLYRQEKAST